MPMGYDITNMFRNASRAPSPGGMDLDSLLNRGIQGTIAGRQEENEITRRKTASDLLTRQLEQAALELDSRMKGYEFGQTQRFDESIANDPNMQATLADAFARGGNPMLTAPTSRHALNAFHRFDESTRSHNNIASQILQNWQLQSGIPGPDGKPMPEPPEVTWAKNVLRIPTTSGGGGNIGGGTPDDGAKALPQPQVPFGGLRAAAATAVPVASAAAASKYLPSLAQKAAPLLNRVPYVGRGLSAAASRMGPVSSGIVGGAGGGAAWNAIDPLGIQAVKENPVIAGLSGVLSAFGMKRLTRGKPQGERPPETQPHYRQESTTPMPLMRSPNQPPAVSPSGPAGAPAAPAFLQGGTSQGAQNLAELARAFKQATGRFPTTQELERLARGGNLPGMRQLPQGAPPYIPKVKGQEKLIDQYFK